MSPIDTSRGNQLSALREGLQTQRAVLDELRKSASGDGRSAPSLRLQSWIGEMTVMLSQLERQIMQLEAAPTDARLAAAWKRYWDILGALAPRDAVSIGRRLRLVSIGLYVQIAIEIILVGYTAYVFRAFDPQTAPTRAQWEERSVAAAEIVSVAEHLERAESASTQRRRPAISQAPASPLSSPSPATPSAPPAPAGATPVAGPSAGGGGGAADLAGASDTRALQLQDLRDEVEGLAAKIGDLRLSEADLRLTKARIDGVLVAFDKEPADLEAAARILRALVGSLTGDRRAPPSLVRLVILGSMLGMLTITIHSNWKYRNNWNTVGFLGWYVTKVLGAPILSLAAVGLLMQVSFAADLSQGGGIGALGLRGASPLLIFSIATLTGLFSNRVFDWLRVFAQAQTGGPAPSPSDVKTSSTGNAQSEAASDRGTSE